MQNKIKHFIEGRLFEWSMTISMLGLAIQITIWPRTVDFSAFHDLHEIVSDQFIGLFMGVAGATRACSLIMNGYTIYGKRFGPVLRSIIAVFCATMWAQFAFALFQYSLQNGSPSPGLPFWTTFVLSELYVAFKAVRDA